MVNELIQNIAILITLSALYSLLTRYRGRNPLTGRVFLGILFGFFTLTGMMMPFHYAPGIIYDGRSVILTLAGLYGGGTVAVIAAFIAGIYRALIGGAGVWAGLATIVATALIGLFFRRKADNHPERYGLLSLYGIGIVAHIGMLACQLLLMLLPSGFTVIKTIWLPILLIFPAATALIGLLFRNEEERIGFQQQLIASEALYRDLVETSQDLVWQCDAEGRYVYLNQACEEIFGYRAEEMLGKKFTDFQTPEWAERDLSKFDRLLKGDLVKGLETVYLGKDGREIHLVFNGRALHDKEGNPAGARGTAHDITRLKDTENSLRQSEEKFRLAFESSPDAININRLEDGMYLEINRGFTSIMGFRPRDVLGKTSLELDIWVNPDDRKRLVKGLREKGTVSNLEARFRAKSGEIKIGLMSAAVITINNEPCILSITRDITEIKRAQEKLRESEERYRSIFHGSSSVMLLIDNETGKIADANLAACRFYGYSYEQIINLTISEITSLTIDDNMTNRGINVADNHSNIRFKHRLADGSLKDVEVFSGKLKIENKPYTFAVVQDISKRIQVERMRKVMYKIANAVFRSETITNLYNFIRKVLGEVIDTTNFYIALYDEKSKMISLPYNVDEKEDFETFPAGKTLTAYVLRTGKPLFVDEKKLAELVNKGEVEEIGEPSKIWLGTPLKIKDKVIGVIAVQSYDNPMQYTENDMEILSFVSTEVALAIEHKKAVDQIRENLAEKELLLRELYHRTKNNMQVISSMLRLKARTLQNDEIKHIFSEIEMKIRSMALVHQKLYESRNLSSLNLKSYFNDLISMIRKSFVSETGNIRIFFEASEDIPVLIDTAIPLGLVLNELLTNAVKYAHPQNQNPEIRVTLNLDEQKRMCIEIADNGSGFPEDFDLEKDSNLGLQTVFALVRNQLGGEITFIYDNGLKCKIVIEKELYEPRI